MNILYGGCCFKTISKFVYGCNHGLVLHLDDTSNISRLPDHVQSKVCFNHITDILASDRQQMMKFCVTV